MQFLVEAVLPVKEKVYLLVRCLDADVRFTLSDNCTLGNLAIENWLDVLKQSSPVASSRPDRFAFVLKQATDKDAVQVGDVLPLADLSATVVESFYTVSGKVGAVLACGNGLIGVGSLLTGQQGQWAIAENNLAIGRPQDSKLRQRIVENRWFLYRLQPIGHNIRPEVGEVLQVTKNKS